LLKNIEPKNTGLDNNPIPLFNYSSDNIRAQKSFEASCYKQLTSAITTQDFTAKISVILEKMGFTTFSLASLANAPRFLLSTLPDDLTQSYQKDNFINIDYAFRYSLSAPVAAPILRSTIEDYMTNAPVETLDMARNRKLSNLYKCHGFYDYYLIPICSGPTCYLLSVTTQASDMDAFYENIIAHERELNLLANLILQLGLLKFKKLFQETEPPKEINIHSKPLKLLKTLAKNDLTLDQTADNLCISLHTADKHSSVIRKALGAKTLVGAVYMALRRGLID